MRVRVRAQRLLVMACLFVGVGADAWQVAAQQTMMLSYEIIDGERINDPLTDTPPDAERGRALFADINEAGCLSCHRVSGMGGMGRALDGIADRVSPAALRLWLVNPKIRQPQTSMPAYYEIAGQDPQAEDFTGEPRLSAQQIEDLIAFLTTLKSEGAVQTPPQGQ
ncbi:MAG: c-type cytochrome [Neomegalonema sp.]|nr:c-type cytochrome [Neomegalonema sp.]